MQEKYTLNTALAAVVGLGCLAAVLYRVFLPAAVLPAVGPARGGGLLPAGPGRGGLSLQGRSPPELGAYSPAGCPHLWPAPLGRRAYRRDRGRALCRGGRRGLRRSNLPVYLPAGAPRLRPIRTAGPPGHRRHPVSGLPVLCRDAPVTHAPPPMPGGGAAVFRCPSARTAV